VSYEEIVERVLPGIEYHQNRYARELAGVVKQGCRWLDVGTGKRLHWGWIGPSSGDLAQRAERVIGCDLVASDIRENPDLTAGAVANALSLPFPNESFDIVSANMVLEHLPDPEPVLTEFCRVLRPGGAVLFVTPNRTNPIVWALATFIPPRARSWIAARVDGRAEADIFPTHYRINTLSAIGSIARRAGLIADQVEVFATMPEFHWPSALVYVEAKWISATRRWPALHRFGSNIVGSLRKPAA